MEQVSDLSDSLGLLPLATGQIPTLVYPLAITVLALLFLSGLVSGSEVAFFSLSPSQLDECANSRDTAERRVIALLNHHKRLLGTILILNNLVNVAIIVLSTMITDLIFGTGQITGYIIQTFVVTAAIVFLGEIVPKVLAKSNNLQFAKVTSKFMALSNRILFPLSTPLMNLDNLIANRVKKHGYKVTKTEIDHAFEMATENESTEEEKEILKGVISFGSKTAKQVMRSRMDVTAFKHDIDFHELLDNINKWGFSRVPVYGDTLDSIEGILYIKDVIPHIHKNRSFEWQQLIRKEIFFVPENKHIDDLLKEFQEKRVHIAIIVDEYGGTSGLVTLEDILEEIVGEITDEFDKEEEVLWKEIEENRYEFDGKVSINDFCKVFDLDPIIFEDVKEDNESLAGLLVEHFSKLPVAGQRIEIQGFLFEVIAVDKKRIKKVEVKIYRPGTTIKDAKSSTATDKPAS